MKRGIIFLMVTLFALWVGAPFAAFSATTGKSFSIIYSSDERGAITPCG
ncbi:MAG: hypothetical protein JXR80_02245 [Deltaproteobacteria bacterium]|nr:hypothetical protein [Deltaproteobacteria bacterium]